MQYDHEDTQFMRDTPADAMKDQAHGWLRYLIKTKRFSREEMALVAQTHSALLLRLTAWAVAWGPAQTDNHVR